MLSLKHQIIGRIKLRHRLKGYKLLKGCGLEIGAFHQPAPVSKRCKVEYCDARAKEDAIKFFPELKITDLVDVDYVCDLDTEGLTPLGDNTFDFVIFNHVIEHVANPINTVKELFRITRPNGRIVISAPDKSYTLDKNRPLTSFSHLLIEYNSNAKEVTDEHYIDFLKGVHPEVLELDNETIKEHINDSRQRREHAHVWDSKTFKDFLTKCFDLFAVRATCLYENSGQDNHFEYYSVWEKESGMES